MSEDAIAMRDGAGGVLGFHGTIVDIISHPGPRNVGRGGPGRGRCYRFSLSPTSFDCLSDFPTCFPKSLLHLPARLVGHAFIVEPIVIR
jgi:hypothetical protein